MKVFEIATIDFMNRQYSGYNDKINHLFLVQKARCLELQRFIEKLNGRIDPVNRVSSQWIKRFVDPFQNSVGVRPYSILENWFSRFEVVLQNEINKINLLYGRMIEAKKKFEDADGLYETQ